MTTAQRARLVVAMGLLNLILATVALTAGIVVPSSGPGAITGAAATPVTTPAGTEPPASPTVGSSAAPTTSLGPTLEPTPSGAPSIEPSAQPTGTPAASAPTIVAVGPTPVPVRPDASSAGGGPPLGSTPQPTRQPTPQPTAHPTARPTPTPQPVSGKVHHPRPPCPGDASGPPGHNKVAPPPSRPCSPGSGDGRSGGGSGLVLVLPLALGGLGATIRRRIAPAGRRLRSVRRGTLAG